MIFTTPIFDNAVADLVKKNRHGYSKCLNDVRAVICPLSFRELCILDDLVTKAGNRQIRKIRAANAEKRWSKSAGYRIIILCDLDTQEAHLMLVYAKKGPLAQSDLTDGAALRLLEQFDEKRRAGEIFASFCQPDQAVAGMVAEATESSASASASDTEPVVTAE